MAAKKKKAKDPKIKMEAGEMSCYGDSVASLITDLIHKGFDVSDFDKICLTISYDGCYYEGDQPSIVAEWSTIYFN